MDIINAIAGAIWSVVEGIYWPNDNPEDPVMYMLGGFTWLVVTLAVIVVVGYIALKIIGMRMNGINGPSGSIGGDDIRRRSDR